MSQPALVSSLPWPHAVPPPSLPPAWCTLFLPLLACARLCLVPLYIFVPSQTPMRQRPLPSKSRCNNLQPGARGTPPLPAAARRPPLPLTARLSYQQSDSKTQGRRPVLPDQSGFLPGIAKKEGSLDPFFVFAGGKQCRRCGRPVLPPSSSRSSDIRPPLTAWLASLCFWALNVEPTLLKRYA